MNTSPKLVPILVVAVLGIASLTLFTSAWGDTNGAPVQAAWSGNFDGPVKGGDGPGKPCLMIEKLYLAIARLGEGTRRKIYAGMFFLGRDR